MCCTCDGENPELDEAMPWWIKAGVGMVGLLIADLYAHPLAGRPTDAQRDRIHTR